MTQSPFTSTPGQYLRYTMLMWVVTRGWLLLLPLIVTAALALVTADVRWAIVTLAYLLVCIPMILTPIAFSHILAPGARRQLALKTVDVNTDRSITITYFTTDPDSGAHLATDSETIPATRVSAIFKVGAMTIIRLKGKELEIILIPDRQ